MDNSGVFLEIINAIEVNVSNHQQKLHTFMDIICAIENYDADIIPTLREENETFEEACKEYMGEDEEEIIDEDE